MSFEDDTTPAGNYDEKQLRNHDHIRAVFTAALETYIQESVDLLVNIALDPQSSPQDAMQAITILMDRVLGCPVKHLKHEWTRSPLFSDLAEEGNL
jgi:hypothetical protein